MSATCIPDVLDDAGLNAFEFRVYCHLRRRSRRGDTCYPAVQSIAAVCGFNRKTVISALSSLEKKGLIQRRPSTGKPTVYYLQPGPLNGLPPSPPDGPARQAGQPVSVTPPGPLNGPTPGPPDGLRKDEDDKERLVHSLSAREASVVDAPVTLENAISRGEEMAIPPDVVTAWWMDRDALGWVRKKQPIVRWQSDIVAWHSAWKRNEHPHSKNGSSQPKPDVDIYADGF